MAVRRGDAGQRHEQRRIDLRERRADRPPPDARLDLGGRAVGDDPSVGHQDRAVGVGVRLLEIVRREEDRPALSGERAHGDPELPTAFDVQRDGRLVEHQQVGVADQRDRETNALGLPAGKLLRSLSGGCGEAGELERLVDVHRIRIERGHHRDDLAHGEIADQLAGLQHRADEAGVNSLARRVAEDGDGAAVRLGEAEHHVDRGRLAGAVRAKQRHGLSGGDREVNSAHRMDRTLRTAEGLRQAVKTNTAFVVG